MGRGTERGWAVTKALQVIAFRKVAAKVQEDTRSDCGSDPGEREEFPKKGDSKGRPQSGGCNRTNWRKREVEFTDTRRTNSS